MSNLLIFVFVAMIAIIMGGIVDIYDRGRTKSAFALSLIFVTVWGIGYMMLVWLEYMYLLGLS